MTTLLNEGEYILQVPSFFLLGAADARFHVEFEDNNNTEVKEIENNANLAEAFDIKE